jgi:hypothetical protein
MPAIVIVMSLSAGIVVLYDGGNDPGWFLTEVYDHAQPVAGGWILAVEALAVADGVQDVEVGPCDGIEDRIDVVEQPRSLSCETSLSERERFSSMTDTGTGQSLCGDGQPGGVSDFDLGAWGELYRLVGRGALPKLDPEERDHEDGRDEAVAWLWGEQHLAAVGVDDDNRIAMKERATRHQGLVGVLRVDEVCAVGVAGVELGVLDHRENLPGCRSNRLWCCAHRDLQSSRIVGQSSIARFIAAAIAWLTVMKDCTVGSRLP